MRAKNLLVIQGGGPTQVINGSLYGVLQEARERGIGRIFGSKRGIEGLVHGKLLDLGGVTAAQMERLRSSPGAILGSSRAKPSEPELEQAVENLRKLDVHWVLLIGGNGTMRAAQMLSTFCSNVNYEAGVIGIPKTVDNDIPRTDRCPGYASAARYIAQSTQDLGMDVHSLPQPVSILETMGRDVGWLAAAAAAGKKDEDDAPHLVYLPEIPFDLEKFLAALDNMVAKQGWAIVVVSEGIRDAAGRLVYQIEDRAQADALERPLIGDTAHFLAETVGKRLKMRCRNEKPGLLGRASMLHVSTQDRKDAELVGRAGVRGLFDGGKGTMVALRPVSDPGETGYEYIPLGAVGGAARAIPTDWICEGAIPVKEKFFHYVLPLVGDLALYPPGLSFGSEFHGDA